VAGRTRPRKDGAKARTRSDVPLVFASGLACPAPAGAGRRSVQFAGKRASQHNEGVRAMTEYLIAAILFVAMITTLVYLWKREHS
jgi:hypothetical protein